MKLLTKKIMAALPKLYSTEYIPLDDKIVICKFFIPDANWTWFVFEGEPNGCTFNGGEADYRFFGMVHGLEREMGFFTLSLLRGIFSIERDRSVFKVPYHQCTD